MSVGFVMLAAMAAVAVAIVLVATRLATPPAGEARVDPPPPPPPREPVPSRSIEAEEAVRRLRMQAEVAEDLARAEMANALEEQEEQLAAAREQQRRALAEHEQAQARLREELGPELMAEFDRRRRELEHAFEARFAAAATDEERRAEAGRQAEEMARRSVEIRARARRAT